MHWAGALVEEWSLQALFEKHLPSPCDCSVIRQPSQRHQVPSFLHHGICKTTLDLIVKAMPGEGVLPDMSDMATNSFARNATLC